MKSISYQTWEQRIHQFAKNKRISIYGARALNANINPLARRYTSDFDLWSPTPKTHAQELAEHLGPSYHVKRVQLPTKKFVYRIYHQSGQLTADITRSPPKSSYYTKQGTQYQTLLNQKQRLEQILRDPSKRYRHYKAQRDLQKIEYQLKRERGY